jgi:pilus assembly protein Flp/PilA
MPGVAFRATTHPPLLALLVLAEAISFYRMSHLDTDAPEPYSEPFRARLRRFIRDTDGATLVEYGLLVLLIAALCIVAIKTMGSGINNTLNSAGNSMP